MSAADDSRIEELTRKLVAPIAERLQELAAAGDLEGLLEHSLSAVSGLGQRLTRSEYLAVLRRLQRSSEQLDPRQLELLAEQAEADDAAASDGDADQADELVDGEVEELIDGQERAEPSRSGGRNPLPESLPRTVCEHDVGADELSCPSCGSERVEIGREVREVLDVAPVRFVVRRHERIKRACRSCGDSGVVTAPPPSGELERVLAGPRLLAHVVSCKYDAHLPLHRLQRLYRVMGAPVAASTLGGWTARVAEELKPVARALWDELRSMPVVGTDASGLRVLDRDAPEGVTMGTMWCYVGYGAGDTKLCAYRYAPTGTGADGPWTHLAGQTGYVQADAANVFDRLFNGKAAHAVEVGCWAHARRKLHELLDADPRVAKPLQRIARVYRAEKAATVSGMSPQERLGLRHRVSRKHVDWLQRWLTATSGREPPRGGLGKACRYWMNHWEALTRFLEDGRIELDNTGVERQIRALALGRKNYLFAGSHRAAERAAVLYTLIRSCDLAGVEPTDWLEDVLVRLADGWPQSRIAELLPHRFVRE